MVMVSNSRSSMTSTTLTTSIGEVPVSQLNDWNNTSFSQLCLRKSASELTMLSQNSDLSADKRAIAAHTRDQLFEEATDNHV
jgi:hypothetical protein